MKNKILKLLRENARMDSTEIASRCEISTAEVENIIKELESSGVICGYTAITNEFYPCYVYLIISVKLFQWNLSFFIFVEIPKKVNRNFLL